MKTFWQTSSMFSPIVVRLLARHARGKPLTDLEIAQRSGLTPHQVLVISQNTTWTGVDLPTMQKFLKGCNLDFCDRRQMKRVTVYIREQVRLTSLNRSNYRYLRRSPDWKNFYEPLMRRLSNL